MTHSRVKTNLYNNCSPPVERRDSAFLVNDRGGDIRVTEFVT